MEVKFTDGTVQDIEGLTADIASILSRGGLERPSNGAIPEMADDVTPQHIYELLADLGSKTIRHAA